MSNMPRPRVTEHGPETDLGLPETLPPGEVLLWQGSPSWVALARRVFLVGWIAVYFGFLMLLEVAQAISSGDHMAAIVQALFKLCLAGSLSVLILGILAKLIARSSVYTITNRRIVMRVGVALPMSINIPFVALEGADLVKRQDGTGDIILTLSNAHRISWLALWPNSHGFNLGRPRPMLRGLSNATEIAEVLGKAVAEATATAKGSTRAAETRGRPVNAPAMA